MKPARLEMGAWGYNVLENDTDLELALLLLQRLGVNVPENLLGRHDPATGRFNVITTMIQHQRASTPQLMISRHTPGEVCLPFH